VPILAQFKTWLDEQPGQVLPKSPIGEAIGYGLGNWSALIRSVADGDLKPDNNAAENAIRPLVVGRKNWLFAGSDKGGRTVAVLASLVASAKQHGLDPFVYLRDVLTRIAATSVSQLNQFLPDHWKAAHQPTALRD
jgi:transposase